jgi:hypothetical protein
MAQAPQETDFQKTALIPHDNVELLGLKKSHQKPDSEQGP